MAHLSPHLREAGEFAMFTNQSRHDGYDPNAFPLASRFASAGAAIVLAVILFHSASAAIFA
jgi:hypothetical protein